MPDFPVLFSDGPTFSLASIAKSTYQQPNPSDVSPIASATPQEARHRFNEIARESVGMSGEEFLHRLDAGEFADMPDDEAHRPHIELAPMAAFGR